MLSDKIDLLCLSGADKNCAGSILNFNPDCYKDKTLNSPTCMFFGTDNSGNINLFHLPELEFYVKNNPDGSTTPMVKFGDCSDNEFLGLFSYIQSVVDGSETKVNSGRGVLVTGNGTTNSPYYVNGYKVEVVTATGDQYDVNLRITDETGTTKLLPITRVFKNSQYGYYYQQGGTATPIRFNVRKHDSKRGNIVLVDGDNVQGVEFDILACIKEWLLNGTGEETTIEDEDLLWAITNLIDSGINELSIDNSDIVSTDSTIFNLKQDGNVIDTFDIKNAVIKAITDAIGLGLPLDTKLYNFIVDVMQDATTNDISLSSTLLTSTVNGVTDTVDLAPLISPLNSSITILNGITDDHEDRITILEGQTDLNTPFVPITNGVRRITEDGVAQDITFAEIDSGTSNPKMTVSLNGTVVYTQPINKNDIQINNAGSDFDLTDDSLSFVETNGDTATISFAKYNVTSTVLPNGDITISQNGNLLSTISQRANNGLSVKNGNSVFGQDVGEAGDPAKLLSNREIPMNGFDINFETSANTDTSIKGNGDFVVGGQQLVVKGDAGGVAVARVGDDSDPKATGSIIQQGVKSLTNFMNINRVVSAVTGEFIERLTKIGTRNGAYDFQGLLHTGLGNFKQLIASSPNGEYYIGQAGRRGGVSLNAELPPVLPDAVPLGIVEATGQLGRLSGAAGTFTSQDGKTITVTKGLITSIV